MDSRLVQMRKMALEVYHECQKNLSDALAVEGVKPLDLAVCRARIDLRNAERVIIALSDFVNRTTPPVPKR